MQSLKSHGIPGCTRNKKRIKILRLNEDLPSPRIDLDFDEPCFWYEGITCPPFPPWVNVIPSLHRL